MSFGKPVELAPQILTFVAFSTCSSNSMAWAPKAAAKFPGAGSWCCPPAVSDFFLPKLECG